MKITPTWSVIIPSYNSNSRLVEVVSRISKCAKYTSERGELIIIDDKSTNKFNYKRLKSENLPIQIIRNTSNLGQSASENIGARLSSGNVLIFLDDDCVPASLDFFEHVLHAYSNNNFVITGDIVTVAQSDSIERVRFPVNFQDFEGIVDARDLQGGCFAIDRKLFLRVGGFSEDLKYFYDIDLAYKIQKRHVTIFHSKGMRAIHLDNAMTLWSELNKTYAAYKQSFITIINRYPESKTSFRWAYIFLSRDDKFDRLVYSRVVFKLVIILYENTFMFLPRKLSVEIYNYLHRFSIYYGVKGLNFP